MLPHIVTSNSQITEINKYFANLTEFLKSLYNQRPLLNDGAKRNRLLSLKIMYTQSKNSMFARFFVNFCLKIMGLLQGNIAGFCVNILPQNHGHTTG